MNELGWICFGLIISLGVIGLIASGGGNTNHSTDSSDSDTESQFIADTNASIVETVRDWRLSNRDPIPGDKVVIDRKGTVGTIDKVLQTKVYNVAEMLSKAYHPLYINFVKNRDIGLVDLKALATKWTEYTVSVLSADKKELVLKINHENKISISESHISYWNLADSTAHNITSYIMYDDLWDDCQNGE